MTKITTFTIICDECNEPILDNTWVCGYESRSSAYLNQEIHFCSHYHLSDYLLKRIESEVIAEKENE